MNVLEVFSTNMRRYRKAAGLTQEELAELSGLHRTYIGRIEQKRVNVSIFNAGRIADALGVSLGMFFVEYDGDSIRIPRNPFRENVSRKDQALPENAGASDTLAASGESDGEIIRTQIDGVESDAKTADLAKPVPDSRQKETADANGPEPKFRYALCTISDDTIQFDDIDTEDPDLTIQILSSLLNNGCPPEDLADELERVQGSIVEFLRTRDNRYGKGGDDKSGDSSSS